MQLASCALHPVGYYGHSQVGTGRREAVRRARPRVGVVEWRASGTDRRWGGGQVGSGMGNRRRTVVDDQHSAPGTLAARVSSLPVSVNGEAVRARES